MCSFQVELDQSGNIIQLKLADFGLACEVTKPLYAVCGTPTYVAPEILLETGYGLKVTNANQLEAIVRTNELISNINLYCAFSLIDCW